LAFQKGGNGEQVPFHNSTCPLAFQKGGNGEQVPFHNSTIGNSMLYQGQIETNLLQLFAYPENSECFYIISIINFEINIVDEQKQARW